MQQYRMNIKQKQQGAGLGSGVIAVDHLVQTKPAY